MVLPPYQIAIQGIPRPHPSYLWEGGLVIFWDTTWELSSLDIWSMLNNYNSALQSSYLWICLTGSWRSLHLFSWMFYFLLSPLPPNTHPHLRQEPYVVPSVGELDMQTRLIVNSQSSACVCWLWKWPSPHTALSLLTPVLTSPLKCFLLSPSSYSVGSWSKVLIEIMRVRSLFSSRFCFTLHCLRAIFLSWKCLS